jgi:hypothetical protein
MTESRGVRRLLLLACLAGCAGPRGSAFENRLVARLPDGADVWWFAASRDGSTAAWSEREGSRAWLVAGGRRFGPYS